jgi:uncharacterized protein YecE (DUF72 family)
MSSIRRADGSFASGEGALSAGVAAISSSRRGGRILVGTASWTDKGLVASGKFYPKGCSSAEDRLRYYASRFPIVEVDSSYYSMPSLRNSHLWVERTPPEFTFNIKAFRALTQHQTPPEALPPDIRRHVAGGRNVYAKDLPAELVDELWKRYLEAIEPLESSGKLGAVHFQFPPWFTSCRGNYAYLEVIRRRMESRTVAVEFRHQSWFTDSNRAATLALERELDLVNVVADEPQGSNASIPAVWEATSASLAILRLHGRNHSTWTKKGLVSSAERFNYDYTETELSQFVAPAAAMAQRARTVHVIFNNNFEDQGQRNAATMLQLLDAGQPAAV